VLSTNVRGKQTFFYSQLIFKIASDEVPVKETHINTSRISKWTRVKRVYVFPVVVIHVCPHTTLEYTSHTPHRCANYYIKLVCFV
jgi:hypothetical protein